VNINTKEYWDDRYTILGGPRDIYVRLVNHRAMYLEVVSAAYAAISRIKYCRILDLGSGPGFLGYLLHSRGHLNDCYTYRAVDFSKQAQEAFNSFYIGRQNCGFVLADLSKTLPPEIREEKWDVIFCTECLEHLTDDIKVVRTAIRLLSKVGRIVISVPMDVKIDSHIRNYMDASRICGPLSRSGLIVNKRQIDRWWVITADTKGSRWSLL